MEATPTSYPPLDPNDLRIKGTIHIVTYYNADKNYAVVRLDLSPDSPTPGTHPLMGKLIADCHSPRKALTGYHNPLAVLPAGLQARVDAMVPQVCLAGTFPFIPKKGAVLEVRGKMLRSRDYGWQIQPQHIQEAIPTAEDQKGLMNFLAANVKGVGPKMAENLVKTHGADLVAIIESEPARLLEVKGINRDKAEAIQRTWLEQRELRDISITLGQYDLPMSIAPKLRERFQERALTVLREDPYALTELRGIGFKKADQIALGMGMNPTAAARLRGAIRYGLTQAAAAGHTALPEERLYDDVVKLSELGDSEDTAMRFGHALAQLLPGSQNRGDVIRRNLRGLPHISLMHVAYREDLIARELKRIIRGQDAAVTPHRAAMAMAQERGRALGDPGQTAALVAAFNYPVTVITGGPGCGKTTVTKTLAEVADSNGISVVMAAPTGKAARRTEEATGFPSDTMHARIRWQGEVEDSKQSIEGDIQSYMDKGSRRLSGGIFVLDESSMADTYIFSQYLKAIPTGARLVLVGDVDQLPSVGAGAVLRDLIDSEMLPVTRLTRVHRVANGSDINDNAYAIIKGDMHGLNLESGKDFHFHEAETGPELVDATVQAYLAMLRKYGAEEVQVMAAQRKTDAGVEALNEALRQAANPPQPNSPYLKDGLRTYHEGDRILCTTNVRDRYSNGEIGILTEINPEAQTAYLTFHDRREAIERADLENMTLGYAITIHKSQGSEFKGVICLAPRMHFMMLNRNLLYTAVTRGKKEVLLIGDKPALQKALRTAGDSRFTGLKEALWTLMAPQRVAAPQPVAHGSRLQQAQAYRSHPELCAAPRSALDPRQQTLREPATAPDAGLPPAPVQQRPVKQAAKAVQHPAPEVAHRSQAAGATAPRPAALARAPGAAADPTVRLPMDFFGQAGLNQAPALPATAAEIERMRSRRLRNTP